MKMSQAVAVVVSHGSVDAVIKASNLMLSMNQFSRNTVDGSHVVKHAVKNIVDSENGCSK